MQSPRCSISSCTRTRVRCRLPIFRFARAYRCPILSNYSPRCAATNWWSARAARAVDTVSADSPDQVCIADVINAVDEEMQVADKDLQRFPLNTYEPCLTEQLWEELSAEIENYLTTISLADMMQKDEVQELSRVPMICARIASRIAVTKCRFISTIMQPRRCTLKWWRR